MKDDIETAIYAATHAALDATWAAMDGVTWDAINGGTYVATYNATHNASVAVYASAAALEDALGVVYG